MSSIKIVVRRPMLWQGEAVQPGRALAVDELQARHICDSGRGELLHADDAVLVQRAMRDDVRATLRQAGRGEAPPPGWPWRPI